MKLQKLLKKLALPVFALVVVSMLAACSSPSGGGSDSNGGSGGSGNDYTPPALEGDKEYDISLDGLTDQEKADLKNAIEEATGSTVSGKMTGSDIEDLKDALSEAGYTYTEKDGTITIIEKPAPSSGSVSPVSSDPLFEITDLTVTATNFEWTEGEWLLKEIEVASNGNKEYSERKIKADSSGIKFTSIVKTVSGTIPAYATEEQKEYLIASGATISGNHYTVTYVYDAKELAEKNKEIDGSFKYYEQHCTIKTNSDKTKYYWTESGKEDYEDESGNVLESASFTTKYYLKKLSGGTNSGNADKPSIGNTFDVKYKDIYLLKDVNVNSQAMPLDKFLEMLDTSDYTRSGNTITLTKSGVDIMLNEGGKAENKTYVTFVCYNKNLFRPLTMEEYMDFGPKLSSPTDYTTDADVGTKIIILTDDGYAKAKKIFDKDKEGEIGHGSGTKPAYEPETPSGNDDKDEYTVMYEDLVLFTCNEDKLKEMLNDAGSKNGNIVTMSSAYITKMLADKEEEEGDEFVAVIFFNIKPGYLRQADINKIKSELVKDTDYKISSDGKVLILTESGLKKQAGNQYDSTDVSNEPLFVQSTLTESAERVYWTEGEWFLKEIREYSDGEKKFKESKISADSSGIKYTEMRGTTAGIITESTDPDMISMLTIVGKVTGNQYKYTRTADEEEIARENEYIINTFNGINNLKTNTDKTKYYWKRSESGQYRNGKEVNTISEYYLEKLPGGTSTRVIIPGDIPIRSDGKYEGVLANGNTKLYTSVEITRTNPEYLVKMWTNSEMTGEPYKTVTGSITTYQSSAEGHLYSGTSSDHTFTIKTANGVNWDVTILFTQNFEIQGKLIKTVFPSANTSEPSYQGIINPDKIYKLYNNKSFDEGTELKGSQFIDKALGSGWVELVDYTVDNENLTITFENNFDTSSGSGSSVIPESD